MLDAYTLTHTLGGRWFGGYGSAPCPVCQQDGRRDQNALTISQGDVQPLLLNCKKEGCTFEDILRSVDASGWSTSPPLGRDPFIPDRKNRQEFAVRIWNRATTIDRTLAEAYLASRDIHHPLSDALRFHPHLRHPTGVHLPALVAKVDGPSGMGIHRTYLSEDGRAKAAVEPARAMLGNVSGGAVRLYYGNGPLIVAEGIENALSYDALCGFSSHMGRPHHPYRTAAQLSPGDPMVWAALSTSGLRNLHLPDRTGALIIAADGDRAGLSATHTLAQRAHHLGWQVIVDPAPDGCDWNDVLRDPALATKIIEATP